MEQENKTLRLRVNGEERTLQIENGGVSLLEVIRDSLGLKGTKFGCGKAACGACTLHIDGRGVRSCTYPASMADGKSITTIEGLGSREVPHPVQQAWIEEVVPQCGYCQPGFMMAAAAMLRENPAPSDDDIDAAITNICRCGTYFRMRKAIHRAATLLADDQETGWDKAPEAEAAGPGSTPEAKASGTELKSAPQE